VKSLGYEESLEETNRLREQDNVTIFEATVHYENLFIRIDVLRRQGNVFDLVEVKAKSFDDEEEFVGKRSGKVSKPWKPYLIDVAFQEYVLRKAFPKAIIRPHLMLADKNAHISVDGLNQKFKIEKNKGRTEARMVGDVSPAALGDPILIEVDVREYVKMLQTEPYEIGKKAYDFEGYIQALSSAYDADQKIPPAIDCGKCSACNFKTTPNDDAAGLKSGYKECWKEALNFIDDDFETPSVLDIWNFRKKQEFLQANRFFLRDVEEMDFDPTKPTQIRQWLQVEKTVAGDAEPGVFPNFDFVRALKAALEKDNGTIFRYAPHENTVLNHIARQLADSDEPDRDELIDWIKTITHNTATGHIGERDMIDLWDLVKKHYYQLDMEGSNSIKQVLPAMLNSSKYLQDKYSKPIYTSRNYTDQVWIQRDAAGRVKDPYKLLPAVFDDIPQDELEKN